MSQFEFMVACLKKFNYPGILIKEDDDVAEIFSTKNRVSLICWLFKEIDISFETFVVNQSIDNLVELLVCHGFCPEQDARKFLNGQLGALCELEILFKMFNHLSDLHKIKEVNLDVIHRVDTDEILDFVERNDNLFLNKNGGNITMTAEMRATKLAEYEKEIEELKKSIESAEKNEDLHELNDELVAAIAIFEQHKEEAETKIKNFLTRNESSSTSSLVKCPQTELFEVILKNVQLFNEYVNGLNHLKNLVSVINNIDTEVSDTASEKIILDELVKLLNEVGVSNL